MSNHEAIMRVCRFERLSLTLQFFPYVTTHSSYISPLNLSHRCLLRFEEPSFFIVLLRLSLPSAHPLSLSLTRSLSLSLNSLSHTCSVSSPTTLESLNEGTIAGFSFVPLGPVIGSRLQKISRVPISSLRSIPVEMSSFSGMRSGSSTLPSPATEGKRCQRRGRREGERRRGVWRACAGCVWSGRWEARREALTRCTRQATPQWRRGRRLRQLLPCKPS